MANVLRIHPKDNVVVAVLELPPGTRLELADKSTDLGVTACDAVPFGHKVAITRIPEGRVVIKYGASIGVATEDITPGEHVHVHNLVSVRGAATS
jgi:altronate dehydratase